MGKDSPETGLVLAGIDGSTPLGFMAALGLLQVLEEHCNRQKVDVTPPPSVRLSWKQLDTWRPVFQATEELDEVVNIVMDDVVRWAESPLLSFRYVKLEKQGPKTVGGLKAPLAVVRAWQRAQREGGGEAEAAFAAGLFCDAVVEESKKSATNEEHTKCGVPYDPDVALDQIVERTFFDFTSRNAQFLEQVQVIRGYLKPDIVRAALERGAPDYVAAQTARTLDWDPTSDTPGAIFTGYRRGFLPVHEWLAFRSLSLFPLAGAGRRVLLTACSGRRLEGEFTWPLWDRPATLDAIRSLAGYPKLTELKPDQRRALGISTLLQAGLTKKADGYTGTFAPARPV